MNKVIIPICFVLLLLASAANAVKLTGTFSLSTDCFTPAKATYLLSNDSSTAQTFTIKATGANSDWISLNGVQIGETPLSIAVAANSSVELYAFVKPQACYIAPGDYTITIEISNGGKTTKEIKVTVTESRALELSITPSKQQAAQCEQKQFEISVKNTGKRSEQVILSVEQLPWQWAKLSVNELNLEKGETKKAIVSVQPACNAALKEYAFSVKATIAGTTFATAKNASIEIADKQMIQISAEAMRACADKKTTSPVKIKNNGLQQDELQLTASGLDFVSIEPPTTVTLAAGEEKEVTLSFDKTSKTQGRYDFTLKAHSTKFEKDTEKKFSLELRNCYNLSITNALLNGATATANPTLCIESEPVYKLTLKNNSVEAVNAAIRATGIDAVISPSQVSIESGKSIDVTVKLDLQNQLPGEKQFSLQASSDNFSLQRDFNLALEYCFNLQIAWPLPDLVELDANCKSELFTVNIKNAGTKEQEIAVSVTGPEWVFLEPTTAKLLPSEQKAHYLYFAPPSDVKAGAYSAIFTIKGAETFEKKIEIKVKAAQEQPAEPEKPAAPEKPTEPEKPVEKPSIKTAIARQQVVETVEKSIKVTVLISNDSNTALKVSKITVVDMDNALIDFSETTLQPDGNIEVPITLFIEPDANKQQISVPLLFSTDKGEIASVLFIDLNKGAEQIASVGLFGLSDLGNTIFFGLIAIVIVVIAAIAIRQGSGGKKSGLAELAEEVEELPAKKLEEIGGVRKARKPRKKA